MIYELRTYTLVPGKLQEYFKYQQEIGREIRGDRYGKLEGCWSTESGTLNRYLLLWSFDDLSERERMWQELSKNEQWKAEYLARIRPLLMAQETKILNPVEGYPFTAPEREGNIYELRTYRVQPGRASEVGGMARDVMGARCKYSSPVALWTTAIGQLNEFVHLWVYDDLNHRLQVRLQANQDPEWRAYLAKSTPLLLEQQSIILAPSPSSPLK
jgi:hypothetical protein